MEVTAHHTTGHFQVDTLGEFHLNAPRRSCLVRPQTKKGFHLIDSECVEITALLSPVLWLPHFAPTASREGWCPPLHTAARLPRPTVHTI